MDCCKIVKGLPSKAAIPAGKLGKVWAAFHQGEQDQTDGTTFDAYRALLDTLVADMKADFSTETTQSRI